MKFRTDKPLWFVGYWRGEEVARVSVPPGSSEVKLPLPIREGPEESGVLQAFLEDADGERHWEWTDENWVEDGHGGMTTLALDILRM